MTQNQAIKQAFAEAEKDQQQKEIDRIKQIVRSHLEKIQAKKEARQKLNEEIRLLEQDLDDLKSGRLDCIADRHEKDERAKEVRIIIVEKIEKQYVPYYPWKSPWHVTWAPGFQYLPGIQTTGYVSTAGSNSILNTVTTATANASTAYVSAANTIAGLDLTATGTQFQAFSRGSYEIGGSVVNL